jgi:hypothetical protein
LFKAVTMGWSYLPAVPWTTATVLTSGIALVSAMHMWRKR